MNVMLWISFKCIKMYTMLINDVNDPTQTLSTIPLTQQLGKEVQSFKESFTTILESFQ